MTKIRELRLERGLSISKASQEAKLNGSALCQVELGKLAPSPAFRVTLAAYYGKPEGSLFNC